MDPNTAEWIAEYGDAAHEYAVLNMLEWVKGSEPSAAELRAVMAIVSMEQALRVCDSYVALAKEGLVYR